MLELVKDMLTNQFVAALCALNLCIDRCDDQRWQAPVDDMTFDQVLFHAIFYADYYLEQSPETFQDQPFHREHAQFFGDYEELEDRVPRQHYAREDLRRYLQHCRAKAAAAIAAEDEQTLQAPAAFARRAFSRAELYLYTMRHIQHHGAQLSVYLPGHEFPWISSGWREA